MRIEFEIPGETTVQEVIDLVEEHGEASQINGDDGKVLILEPDDDLLMMLRDMGISYIELEED